jgi:transposase-like protein
MSRASKFSPEVRERSVKMVLEHQGEYEVSNRGSHLAALRIASEHGVHLRRKWTPWKVQEGGHGDITARR